MSAVNLALLKDTKTAALMVVRLALQMVVMKVAKTADWKVVSLAEN